MYKKIITSGPDLDPKWFAKGASCCQSGEREKLRERERERERQTDKQKQRERETDRQTDRQTETEREREREKCTPALLILDSWT